MLRNASLLLGAALLAIGLAQAEPPTAEKPETKRPLQAKPVQKPTSTTDRDKLGITGYGSDPGEESQERPNPADFKPAVAKPATKRPLQAKPVQKPTSTTDRGKLGHTGYGEDPGEETQERPNPADFKPAQRSKPVKQIAPATP